MKLNSTGNEATESKNKVSFKVLEFRSANTAFALAGKTAAHFPHTEGQNFLTFLFVLKESLPFLRAAVLSFSNIA